RKLEKEFFGLLMHLFFQEPGSKETPADRQLQATPIRSSVGRRTTALSSGCSSGCVRLRPSGELPAPGARTCRISLAALSSIHTTRQRVALPSSTSTPSKVGRERCQMKRSGLFQRFAAFR